MINKNNLKNTMKIQKKRNGLPVKCITTNVAGTLLSTGTITSLTLPAQGVGTNQRTGDEINIENIELTTLSYYGDDVNVIRYIVLQTKGVTPTLATGTFLQTGASTTIDVTSLYVPFYEGRFFDVIYDKTIILSSSSSRAAVVDRQVLKPKVSVIPFIPASTTVTDGQIIILAISDSAIVPHPSFDFTARIWFRDI